MFLAGTSVTPRRGRDLWAKLRQTVKQSSLADVLSALGAVPSGFRDSTLAKLLNSSRKYSVHYTAIHIHVCILYGNCVLHTCIILVHIIYVSHSHYIIILEIVMFSSFNNRREHYHFLIVCRFN